MKNVVFIFIIKCFYTYCSSEVLVDQRKVLLWDTIRSNLQGVVLVYVIFRLKVYTFRNGICLLNNERKVIKKCNIKIINMQDH